MSARVLLSMLCVALLSGCAQKVWVRTTVPGGKVTLDDEELGPVPEEGMEAEVTPGYGRVPYRVEDGEKVYQGEIERNGYGFPMGAVACAGCSGMTCFYGMPLAFCAANPSIWFSLLFVNVLGVTATLDAMQLSLRHPSWYTVPCVAGLGLCALSPMLLAPLIDRVPPNLVLGPTLPEEGPAADEGADERPDADPGAVQTAPSSSTPPEEGGLKW